LNYGKYNRLVLFLVLPLCFSDCHREGNRKEDVPEKEEAFSLLYPEKQLPQQTEMAFAGAIPASDARISEIYLYLDLQAFHYRRRQKDCPSGKSCVTRTDSGALSFIQGTPFDPHALVWGLEGDSTNRQYFLIRSEEEIEWLTHDLKRIEGASAPILRRQAIERESDLP